MFFTKAGPRLLRGRQVGKIGMNIRTRMRKTVLGREKTRKIARTDKGENENMQT